jgi:hypothetical protein
MKSAKKVLLSALCGACCCALIAGCMTSKTTTVTPAATNTVNGVTTTNFTTNVVVTVNQATLALDCAGIQAAAGLAVSLTVQKDPAAKPILQNIQTTITGVLNGAGANSVSQIAGLFGGSGNAAVVQNLTPVVNQMSSLEQSLVAKYGATVGGQITIAILNALNNGIAQGL